MKIWWIFVFTLHEFYMLVSVLSVWFKYIVWGWKISLSRKISHPPCKWRWHQAWLPRPCRGQARQPSRPLAADLSPSAQEKTSHRAESKDQSTHVCFALWQLTINKKRTNIVNCYLFTWINCGAMRAALRRSTPGHAVRAAVDEPEFVFAFMFYVCFVLSFFLVLSLSLFLSSCSGCLFFLVFIIENVQGQVKSPNMISW